MLDEIFNKKMGHLQKLIDSNINDIVIYQREKNAFNKFFADKIDYYVEIKGLELYSAIDTCIANFSTLTKDFKMENIRNKNNTTNNNNSYWLN